MPSYLFETDQLGFSDKALHLLRNRFNYETIDYWEIDEIILGKGRQVSNWLIVLIIGLSLVSISLFLFYKVIYEYFFGESFHVFYTQQFLLPILPSIIGCYSIYSALIKGYVLRIIIKGKTKTYPIEQLRRKNQIEALSSFLHENTLTQQKFKMNFKK